MFDNVRLKLKHKFSPDELETFCSRHNLAKEQTANVYSNRALKNLTQNKGIYIKVEPANGVVKIECSLHKLYNETTSGKRQNWNDFNFEQAQTAADWLQSWLGLELQAAKVVRFELGINIECDHPPETYMKQLDCITVNNRAMRILEDPKYKEYKAYSTNRSKDKRIVYVFYDKTFEARTKYTASEDKKSVPDNILRIEMKYKRVSGLEFKELMNRAFKLELLKEFAQRFTEGLKFITQQRNPPKLTPKQFELYKALKRHGKNKEVAASKEDYKAKRISKRQYYYKLHLIEKLMEITEDLEVVSGEIEELQGKIRTKIERLQKGTAM